MTESGSATQAAAPGEFEELRATWQTLGRDDPLWAILTRPEGRHGKWDLDAFLATGEADVQRYAGLLDDVGRTGPIRSLLDFGCGVGRLSLAWSRRAEAVTGVDIASTMIERGRQIMAGAPNVRLLVNDASDLRQFDDATFDVVFSHICLQHIPWSLASGYITEFGRVVTPGGYVAFQLPTRGREKPSRRHQLINLLPAGVRARYRRWRHGTTAVFDMYYTPSQEVMRVAKAAGLDLRRQEPDDAAGVGIEGYIYVFRRDG